MAEILVSSHNLRMPFMPNAHAVCTSAVLYVLFSMA